jgi:hypothetical protein
MAMVEFEWTMKLPNEYMVDHSFTDGHTRTCVYDGPDKLYLIIENDTGKEHLGPVTELEKADGRPVPKGCRYVEVDCISNPLICELKGPILDEMDEDYTSFTHPPGGMDMEGHNTFTYQTPLRPLDVYEPDSIHVDEDDNITVQARTIPWAVMGSGDRLPDWDDVRAKRMQLLSNSDSEVVDDMPTDLKAKWLDYRQRLRDWPATMQDAGIPAWIAYNMEPIDPASEEDPLTGDIIVM